ncbi:MAG: TRAM domain-containing protein [Pseudolysinimonas sp.]|uniref:class I SAM-dependent RNA methyltransferase n=1 Tax=Pseudolysinimonas sp. TaxID=2680009 RepID=UPI003264C47B
MGDMQGTEIEVEATNMAHGGESVARLDGRVIFVADAIPGERLRVRVTDDSKPKFWRADTVEVLDASPHRVPHIWAEASVDRDPAQRPGGADYGHIALGQQRVLKAQVLTESLARMAKVDRTVDVEALPGPTDGTGWRTRERLHVAADGSIGPYAARSHRVVAVADLPLAVDRVRDLAPLRESMPGVKSVQVLAPSLGDGARLVIDEQKPTVIRERVGMREFRVDDTGFWQVHAAAAETLTAAVQDAIDPTLFDEKAANLDLYGGVGLLAAAVGDRFGHGVRITTVESDARATEHAAENLADWLGAAVITERVERWARSLADVSASERTRLAAGTVILDPPRSGAGAEVLGAITTVAPAQIVYVSCDPVAFARDVALLAEAGYQLVGLRAFDLFPHTHHVEAVGSFQRA